VFVSSYSVLCSEDKVNILKFLSRVYDNGSGVIERRRMEDLLHLAYGPRLRGKSEQVRIYMRNNTIVELRCFDVAN